MQRDMRLNDDELLTSYIQSTFYRPVSSQTRPTLVHRTPTASIRPIAEEQPNAAQRVASIRPVAIHKATAAVAPHAVTTLPDQSSSSSTTTTHATVQSMVTSTQAPSSTSITPVPQAVVPPRFETQEAVIASSDGSQGSAISSSSVVLNVEPVTGSGVSSFEMATSSDNGGGRKRPQSGKYIHFFP